MFHPPVSSRRGKPVRRTLISRPFDLPSSLLYSTLSLISLIAVVAPWAVRLNGSALSFLSFAYIPSRSRLLPFLFLLRSSHSTNCSFFSTPPLIYPLFSLYRLSVFVITAFPVSLIQGSTFSRLFSPSHLSPWSYSPFSLTPRARSRSHPAVRSCGAH